MRLARAIGIAALVAAVGAPAAQAQFLPDGMQMMPRNSRPALLFTAPAASAPSSITPTRGPVIACGRTSTGTYQPTATTLATAASGTCRVDYRGLLVEESRTNISLQSAAFNTAWQTAGIGAVPPTVTADQAVSPDGTTTADKISFPAVSGSGNLSAVFQTAQNISASTYSLSVWLQAVSGGKTTYLNANQSSATYIRTACMAAASWSLCSFTGTTTASNWSQVLGVDLRDASQSAQPAGTFYAWGYQWEQGPFATSYIPTTTTAVTRAADQIDLGAITLSAHPSLSATVNLEGLPASGTATALSATDGTTALTLAVDSSGHAKCSYGATSDTTTGTVTPGTASKIVCKYDGSAISACIGSTCHGTAATLSITAAQTHLYIGWDGSGSYLNGFLSTVCSSKRSGGCS